jgi:hypothetical protein
MLHSLRQKGPLRLHWACLLESSKVIRSNLPRLEIVFGTLFAIRFNPVVHVGKRQVADIQVSNLTFNMSNRGWSLCQSHKNKSAA